MSGVDRRSSGPRAGRPLVEPLALTVVALLVSLVAGVAFLVPLVTLGYDVETTGVLLGLTAAGQVGLLAVAVWYVRFRDVRVPVGSPSRRDVVAVGAGTVLALVLAVVSSLVLAVLDLLPESAIGDVATSDPTFLLGLAGLSVVLVAPAEELLFRGAIQGRFRQQVGPVPAILAASLLFGSMHLANYSGAVLPVLAGAALVAIVGCVLGAVYEYTGNLVVPIATHAIYNVLLLVVSYVSL